jgi:hypothetical protein
LLEQVFETDQAILPGGGGEIDGFIDSRQTSTFEYDADGNLVREVSVATPTGFPSATAITLLEYDARGNVVSIQQELDGNSDGTIEIRVSSVNIYNSRGQLVKATSDTDLDGDGTIDSTSVVTTVYDGVKR